MSLFRVRKPRPFHHEMIFQGRKRVGENDSPTRMHFTSDKNKERQKRVVPLELVLLVGLVLLLAYLLYM